MAGNNGSSSNLFAEGLAGLALSASGKIYASEATVGHTIYSVGLGTATALTSAVTAAQGLAFGANGNLLAVSGDPSNPLIASIDPTTGNTTTLSDNNGIGTGPAYASLRGITIGNRAIYVTGVEWGTPSSHPLIVKELPQTTLGGLGIKPSSQAEVLCTNTGMTIVTACRMTNVIIATAV